MAARGKKAARAPRASSPDEDSSEAEDEDADNAYLAERTARLAANKRQLAALGLAGDAGDGARKAARRGAGGSSAEGSGTGFELLSASPTDAPGGVEVPVRHAGALVVGRAPSEQARTQKCQGSGPLSSSSVPCFIGGFFAWCAAATAWARTPSSCMYLALL